MLQDTGQGCCTHKLQTAWRPGQGHTCGLARVDVRNLSMFLQQIKRYS